MTLSHELGSEQTNERSGAKVRSEQTIEWYEGMAQFSHLGYRLIFTTVHCNNSGTALWVERLFKPDAFYSKIDG